jgi:hypothetical protein
VRDNGERAPLIDLFLQLGHGIPAIRAKAEHYTE